MEFLSLQPFPQCLLGVLSFLEQQQSWISHLARVHHPDLSRIQLRFASSRPFDGRVSPLPELGGKETKSLPFVFLANCSVLFSWSTLSH